MVLNSRVSMSHRPFATAAPLAYRPLNAIAAIGAGGVPQRRIQRILAELIPVLDGLHQKGKICGNISVHTVGLDELGQAHLMSLAFVSTSIADRQELLSGYAPLEFYVDDQEWPRGPWSDIYALSAVVYALIVGHSPRPANERASQDDFQPLVGLGLTNYTIEFLTAIDASLAMQPHDRPQSMTKYAEMLGLAAYLLPITAAEIVAEPSGSVKWVAAPQPMRKPPKQKIVGIISLTVAALIGAAISWAFFKAKHPVITRSELALLSSSVAVTPSLAEAQSDHQANGNNQSPENRNTSSETETDGLLVPSIPPRSEELFAVQPDGNSGSRVTSETGKTTAKVAKAAPALIKVAINVRPWGEIVIDGESRGITPPLKTVMLRPGKYAVTIINSARPPYSTTLMVTPDKPAIITHAFR